MFLVFSVFCLGGGSHLMEDWSENRSSRSSFQAHNINFTWSWLQEVTTSSEATVKQPESLWTQTQTDLFSCFLKTFWLLSESPLNISSEEDISVIASSYQVLPLEHNLEPKVLMVPSRRGGLLAELCGWARYHNTGDHWETTNPPWNFTMEVLVRTTDSRS